ncbi:hypothetical protein DFH05DRAFT_1523776 [Lentinula detonsa]|uniref:Uncharacterized protein n=1 Tax=Lentinula detonsa TaxID=2804962 RepID=A0A9W8TYS1_9AGAR|nr:hypothetical protein DFH05DRAFT_1523776 [Lentinula detonsa]
MDTKILQPTVREANSNPPNGNTSNGTHSGSHSPPQSNGTSPNHDSSASSRVNDTAGTSKATIGGSIAGGVIGIALMLGLLWLWKTRKNPNTRRIPSQRLRGWVRRLQKGHHVEYAVYAQDLKERPPIDADDGYSDSSQILRTLPTPATHLSLALPLLPPDVYFPVNVPTPLPNYSVPVEGPFSDGGETPALPPRYWQIHNSSSAASLHRDLSSHKLIGSMATPAPASNNADHGHVFDSSPALPEPLPTLPFSTEPTSEFPLSPLSLVSLSQTELNSYTSHDFHSRSVLTRTSTSHLAILADNPAGHPQEGHPQEAESNGQAESPTSSNESELTIRNLRYQVEVLAEENARLSRQNHILSTREGTGRSIEAAAYIGDH